MDEGIGCGDHEHQKDAVMSFNPTQRKEIRDQDDRKEKRRSRMRMRCRPDEEEDEITKRAHEEENDGKECPTAKRDPHPYEYEVVREISSKSPHYETHQQRDEESRKKDQNSLNDRNNKHAQSLVC